VQRVAEKISSTDLRQSLEAVERPKPFVVLDHERAVQSAAGAQTVE
jgi:hypothetical protein